MIDTAAIIIFNLLIVYTVFKAVKLDKVIPWFSDQDQSTLVSPKKESRK